MSEKKKAEELADKLIAIAKEKDIQFTYSDEEMKKELLKCLLRHEEKIKG